MIKSSTILITFLAVATFAVGCDQQKPSAEPTTTIVSDSLLAVDLENLTTEQKTNYVQTMFSELTALDEELAKLAAKVDISTDALKAEATPMLRALREKITHLKQQLVAVTPATWANAQAEARETYASMTNGFTEARRWVSEKISP